MKKYLFIPVLMALVVLIYSIALSPESIAPDGSVNLLLGKELLDGRYSYGFLHRMPLIPSLCSLLYPGFGVGTARFIMPLIFMVLSIPVTFLFAREFTKSGEAALLSSVLLLAFPEFWRWGMGVLTDIPLMVFAAALLYLFLRALKDKGYFVPCGIVLGLGMVTKLSFTILPVFLLLYLIWKRRDLFRAREFWACVIIGAAIFLAAFALISGMGGEAIGGSASQIEQILGQLNHPNKPFIFNLWNDLYRIAFFPLAIFLPFGIYGTWKRRMPVLGMVLIYSISLFLIFPVLWSLKLRYLSSLYPVLMVFVAEGFLFLRGRLNGRVVAVVFAALFAVSFVNSMQLVSLDSNTYWGVRSLSDYAKTLEGKIASDYMPHYLNISNDVLLGGLHDEAVNAFFSNISHRLAKESGISYIILSVYADYGRYLNETGASPETYPMQFCLIELPFIMRPYSAERPPPDYRMHSALYRKIEGDPGFEKVKDIYRGEQPIFSIYRVL